MVSPHKQFRRWAFTVNNPASGAGPELIKKLKTTARRWCFQLEVGESGTPHFQGRISFKQPKRATEVGKLVHGHASIEHDEAASDFYALKEGASEGPWTDKDELLYKNPLYNPSEWRPWQQETFHRLEAQTHRQILVVVDYAGNKGKSIVAHHLAIHRDGLIVPPIIEKAEDMISYVHSLTKPGQQYTLIFDIPKSVVKNPRFLGPLYTAIEALKSGHCFDRRYKGRQHYIKTPKILVFTNADPPSSALSDDRWVIQKI